MKTQLVSMGLLRPLQIGAPDETSAISSEEDAFRGLAHAGLALLRAGQFDVLVERFGYATALGRPLGEAVARDLAQALQDASGRALLEAKAGDVTVSFHQDSPVGIDAAIDCALSTECGRRVWVSFVVSADETGRFFTLEDICGEPAPSGSVATQEGRLDGSTRETEP